MSLKEDIEKYVPYNEQEEQDKRVMLKYLNDFDNVLTRENEYGHFSCSAWIVNKERTKVLMIYHNIYKSWSWTGGHADGEEDLLSVTIREVKEETGLKTVIPVFDDIFSLEIACVDGHEKRGKYVSSHVHLNLSYLIEADENEPIRIKEDENSGVKWIKVEDAEKESCERWMNSRIYRKLIEKEKSLHKYVESKGEVCYNS